MPAALLTQGVSAIRDSLSTLITHVTFSDATAAFGAGHTGINATDTNKSVLVKAATDTVIDAATIDSLVTIDGTTEFTGKQIFSIGVSKGLGVLQTALGTGTGYGSPTIGSDTLSRTVRSLSIGVQSGDSYTLGIRSTVTDQS